MKPPRGLTAEEAALWRKVAATVVPLNPSQPVPAKAGREGDRPKDGGGVRAASKNSPRPRSTPPAPLASRGPPPSKGEDRGLDSHWDRRLKTGTQEPDFTLDLHGLTLDQAHRRLESGLAQARSLGARLVLVVTGKPRPTEAADRGTRRGAIRAKLIDWLAAGPHGDCVAAIRQANRRHGGDGALYLVLRKGR